MVIDGDCYGDTISVSRGGNNRLSNCNSGYLRVAFCFRVLPIVTECNKVFHYVTLSILTKHIVTKCKTYRFIIEYMLYLYLSVFLGDHNKHSYSIGFICYHSVLADCFNKST